MIGIDLSRDGLGNQLFFYVSTRCIAEDLEYDFSILGREYMANNIHSDCGLYFMDIDFGKESKEEDYPHRYKEKDDRLFLPNAPHDMENGAYVSGPDPEIKKLEDGTFLKGNLQSEAYFLHHKDEIKQWLKVKEEYDCYEYSKDNLCILHLRCGDYLDNPELLLKKKYWLDGMKFMKTINPDMEFMIVTNDVREAKRYLPGIPVNNFDLAKDYSILKNAKYLLLGNSSFPFFPAFTSETNRYILAPKYWARHNVSDGYWTSEQNIYTGWNYMDRNGKVFSAEECRAELEEYKKTSKTYATVNIRPEGIKFKIGMFEASFKKKFHRFKRLVWKAGNKLIGR